MFGGRPGLAGETSILNDDIGLNLRPNDHTRSEKHLESERHRYGFLFQMILIVATRRFQLPA